VIDLAPAITRPCPLWVKSRHLRCKKACPLWVISGHMQCKKGMSALLPIATAKADSLKRSCLLYPRKLTCALQLVMSALGQKRSFDDLGKELARNPELGLVQTGSPRN
jgi:hypothetical protein